LSKSALGIDWSMKAILSGNRKDSDFSTDINGSYDVVHLFASKKLSREWTGFVKVENAFDKQYQLARGYDAVSRGVFVTLQYQPK
jgi:vitamin B12 transporter